MRRPIYIILAVLLALGAIEGIAYWWMNPAPAGLGEPVLAYRPQGSAGVPPADQEIRGQKSGVRSQEEAPAPAPGPEQSSSSFSSSQHLPPAMPVRAAPDSSVAGAPAAFSISEFQLLPDLVSRSIPSLRCSTGTAARIDRPDGITVHVAFFEWDLAASNNVLEAFKHLPEECMGTIGMTLVKIHPPREYEVRGQETEVRGRETGDRGQESEKRRRPVAVLDRSERDVPHRGEGAGGASESNQESGVGSQESANAAAQSTSSDPKSKINTHQSSISLSPTDNRQPTTDHSSPSSSTDHRSLITDHSLSFDHTEFRDSSGKTIHAFKGVWVSGASTILGDGLRGGLEQWRQIRWRAALKRFRPAHARTAQGAVHGIANPDRAWEIFEESMLKDLTFEL